MTKNDIIAYVGTILDDIKGKTEEEIIEIIASDIRLMDAETASFTEEHFEEIVAEAISEAMEGDI